MADRPKAHYNSLSPRVSHSIDLENDADSDTTLASDSFLSKPTNNSNAHRISRYEKSSALKNILTWVRWGTVVFFQIVIIVLLLPSNGGLGLSAWVDKGWSVEKTETGGDINGLYVPASHKYTLLAPEESKFIPNMTSDADRMEIRKNWDMLMPLGSGTVKIPDWEQHPMLGKPIVDDPIRSGAIFEASWTHALHCLYYTLDTYHQFAVHQKYGFDGERDDMHATHCFEYLRNQILCMADMTLEGSESVLDSTGEGQAHMCRNREEAMAWIEERRVDDIRSIVGP